MAIEFIKALLEISKTLIDASKNHLWLLVAKCNNILPMNRFNPSTKIVRVQLTYAYYNFGHNTQIAYYTGHNLLALHYMLLSVCVVRVGMKMLKTICLL